jgi:DNA-binding IclR family transcriptional regulator
MMKSNTDFKHTRKMVINYKMADNQKNSAVPAVERALDILEYIGEQAKPISLKEAQNALKIPPASFFRIISELTERGYLREDNTTSGKYVLGHKILYLSQCFTRQIDLNTVALHCMRNLSEKCNQTSQLGALQNNGVVYLNQVLSTRPISITAALGTILPVNVSAAGKVLTAFLPENEKEEFLRDAKFASHTGKTITNIDEFRKELNKVKEYGVAMDDEEYAVGIGCLAAPVFNHKGRCVAAVGITGYIDDYKDKLLLSRNIQYVTQAAKEISEQIGCQA